MKPRIRKKGENVDGTARYVLEYIKQGNLINKVLNPQKLVKILDCPKEEVISKEKGVKNGR